MSTICANTNTFDFKRIFTDIFYRTKIGESEIVDTTELQEALDSINFNLVILENNIVKGVYQYISGKELCDYTGLENMKILKILDEILKKGAYNIVNRNWFFKKTEYLITGLWDC